MSDRKHTAVPDFEDSDFKRSSACNFDPVCVEVAMKDGFVAIRDSKDADKPPHIYTNNEWSAFIEGAKNGEFDI